MNCPFDRKALRKHRERVLNPPKEGGDFLYRHSAPLLTDRLLDVTRAFPVALDLSPLPLAPFLPKERIERLWQVRSYLSNLSDDNRRLDLLAPDLFADEEFIPFGAQSFDLILSHLSLHWANDLLGTLLQMRYALKPDGMLLISMFGGETLTELRQALIQAESEIMDGLSPRIAPMAELRQVAGLLQRANFALPVVDSEQVTVTYPDLFRLMRDLRSMGESNVLQERSRRFTSRRLFHRAEEIYRHNFATTEGKLRATFEIFYLTAWAPHSSQQQPAKRGSGQISLGDFLKKE